VRTPQLPFGELDELVTERANALDVATPIVPDACTHRLSALWTPMGGDLDFPPMIAVPSGLRVDLGSGVQRQCKECEVQ